MKRCFRCGEKKLRSEFGPYGAALWRWVCKQCERDEQIRDLYRRVARIRVTLGLDDADHWAVCRFLADCTNLPLGRVLDICAEVGPE